MSKFNVYVNGKLAGQIEAPSFDAAKIKAVAEFPTSKGCAHPVGVRMPVECVIHAKQQSLKK